LIYSYIYLFICLYLYILSFIHLFIHSFNYLFIYLFILFIYLFMSKQQADQPLGAQHDRRAHHQQEQHERVSSPREPGAGCDICQQYWLLHRQHWAPGLSGRKEALGAWSHVADHQGK
jgi:hypothetical protein